VERSLCVDTALRVDDDRERHIGRPLQARNHLDAGGRKRVEGACDELRSRSETSSDDANRGNPSTHGNSADFAACQLFLTCATEGGSRGMCIVVEQGEAERIRR
jgi:hypothetical protein